MTRVDHKSAFEDSLKTRTQALEFLHNWEKLEIPKHSGEGANEERNEESHRCYSRDSAYTYGEH